MKSKYFKMNRPLEKKEPSDFGLKETDEEDIYISEEDGSKWRELYLYDFGFGREKGYERLPALSFSELFDLLVFSSDNADHYGAASVLLMRHPQELLDVCLCLFEEEVDLDFYKDAFRTLKLDDPVNRTATVGKSGDEISADFDRWEELGFYVEDLLRSK